MLKKAAPTHEDTPHVVVCSTGRHQHYAVCMGIEMGESLSAHVIMLMIEIGCVFEECL